MIYSREKAKLIQEQSRRFTTCQSHHLAGQFANFDHWLSEIEAALEVLSSYNIRFNRMRDAQKKWVDDHGTVVHSYCPMCQGRCEFSTGIPSPPVRYSGRDMESMHRELSDTAYELFLRCHRNGLLEIEYLKEVCERIGTGLDPNDLLKKQ